MKKVIIFTVLLIFAASLCACSGAGTHYALFDEDIDTKLRGEISLIDAEIIQGLIEDDYSRAEKHMSSALTAAVKDFDIAFSQMSGALEGYEAENYKDIHIKINRVGEYHPKVIEDLTDDEGMIISVSGYSKEMYVSMKNFAGNRGEFLLYIEYTKQKEGWQVYRITMGELSFFDMDANGLYKKAKKLSDKGYDIAAAVYYKLYSACVRPSDYIQYINEAEMQSFFEKLINGVNEKYSFPIALGENSGNEIYGIDVNVVIQGIVPTVIYITDSELSDANSAAIQAQAYSIHEELKNLWPGFGEAFDYFLYSAYNEYPTDADKMYHCYSSIVEKDQ